MPRRSIHRFRLYVADDKEPQRAILEGIRMTPTLLRLAPLPIRRVVGTLVDTQRVLETLGLDANAL
jgi:circadian clock protein KaiB